MEALTEELLDQIDPPGKTTDEVATLMEANGVRLTLETHFPHIPWERARVLLDSPIARVVECVSANWRIYTHLDRQYKDCQGCIGRVDYRPGRDTPPRDVGCANKYEVNKGGGIDKVYCPLAKLALEDARRDFRLHKALLPKRYRTRTLDNFDTAGDARLTEGLAAARDFVKGFGEDDQPGLLLLGPPGTGKTHLAAGIVHEVVRGDECHLRRPVSATYWAVPDLLAAMRGSFSHDHEGPSLEGIHANLRSAPVLVLDDLAKEHLAGGGQGGYATSAWAQEQLFLTMDHRYGDCRPLIVTSNLDANGLEARYGKPLVSRLYEMCRWVVLDVPDHRRREPGADRQDLNDLRNLVLN